MSIVVSEKTISKVNCSDWESKVHHLQEASTKQRLESFVLRNDSHHLRNDTEIETLWNTYNNNRKLADRILEIERWRNNLEQCLQLVINEIAVVNNEKCQTDNLLQQLNLRFSLLNECLTLRNERHKGDLCEDIGQTELKKEHSLLETLKKTLTERSHAGWEQIKRLEEVKTKLEHDLRDKDKTLMIDKSCLQLQSNSADISYKYDPLRILSSFTTHETWVNHCEFLKKLADNEVATSRKLCESMYVPRQQTKNQLLIQNETANFALRRRIYETDKLRKELYWQNEKTKQEMERLMKEINQTEQALEAKTNILKVAETRVEKRLFRPGIELCNDDSLFGLRNEIVQLNETRQQLSNQLEISKTRYNEMENQMLTLELELADKNHALHTDLQCLNMRVSTLNNDKNEGRIEG